MPHLCKQCDRPPLLQLSFRLVFFRRRDPQFEIKFACRKQPRPCRIHCSVSDKGNDFVVDLGALFDDRENVAQDLTWMLIVG